METFSLFFDPESIRVSKSHLLTGRIHAVIDGYPFPDAQWNDLCASVLTLWIRRLATLESDRITSVNLPFMDGPYSITITTNANQKTGLQKTRDGEMYVVFTNDARIILKCVAKAAETLLRAALKQHYNVIAIHELQNSVE